MHSDLLWWTKIEIYRSIQKHQLFLASRRSRHDSCSVLCFQKNRLLSDAFHVTPVPGMYAVKKVIQLHSSLEQRFNMDFAGIFSQYIIWNFRGALDCPFVSFEMELELYEYREDIYCEHEIGRILYWMPESAKSTHALVCPGLHHCRLAVRRIAFCGQQCFLFCRPESSP